MKVVLLCILLVGRSFAQEKHKVGVSQFEAPTYLPIARVAQVQGSVHLNLEIDASGTVVRAEVDGHPMLRRSALDTIKGWKFTCLDCKYGETFTHVMEFRYEIRDSREGGDMYTYEFPILAKISVPKRLLHDGTYSEMKLTKKRWWNPFTWF
jgi:TonB family protein